ncbi:MAG: alanine racemase, partial [Defluviitaleaceae bacterium]|nr:alanine racemase [Defluviitaleaceae bacterium]
ITEPILIIGPIIGPGIKGIVEAGLTVTVFSLDIAKKLSLAGGGKVHIKIDSGMNRVGFRVNNQQALEAACQEILQIADLPNIQIEGIFSHFASSDSNPDFTKEQFECFNNVIRRLEQLGLHIPIKHISNSGGVLNHPECNLDMVRIGVLMYGLAPCSTPEGAEKLAKMGILPALRFKSSVGQVKTIGAGESVGYGRSFVAERSMEVATIPLGYGDGISRQLSNKGYVMINGCKCPIIGSVCMDQFMVNVTGANAVHGNEVTIIGQGVSAEDVAQLQGSINYEVATGLSQRIQRQYKI